VILFIYDIMKLMKSTNFYSYFHDDNVIIILRD